MLEKRILGHHLLQQQAVCNGNPRQPVELAFRGDVPTKSLNNISEQLILDEPFDRDPEIAAKRFRINVVC